MSSYAASVPSLVIAVTTWLAVLIFQSAFKRLKVKINSAQNAEQIGQFGCNAAKKAVGTVIKVRIILLILIFITLGYLIISTSLQALRLLNDKTSDALSLSELLQRLPNVDLFFGVIFLVGTYTIANIIISYLKTLIKKCEELGVSGELK